MIREYKEKLTDDEVFVMTAAEQLRQQGAILKAQETARNLLAFGDSSDKVARVTGLDLDMVLKLKSSVDSNTQH